MHRIGDHQRFGHHPPVVADLDVLGIQPQIRICPFQRPAAKQLDLLIQPPADVRDAVLGHPLDPQLLDQPVDLAGRDTVDIGLHHDRHDRLLRPPPRLQKRREIAARPRPRDQQLDLPDPGLPRPRAIPIAIRRALLRGDLTQARADLL